MFHENSIEPYSINSIEHITFRDDEGRRRLRSECEEICRIAAEINCPYVVVVPGRLPPDTSRDDVINESVKTLNEVATIAEAHVWVSLSNFLDSLIAAFRH